MNLTQITPCELLALTTLVSQKFLQSCDADELGFWGDFWAVVGANLIMLSDQINRKKTDDTKTDKSYNKAMDNKKQTEQKVVEMLAKQLSKDPTKIKPTDRIVEDLGADSLDNVEMLMNLEESYGITIPDDEASKLQTVGDLVKYLDKHQS